MKKCFNRLHTPKSSENCDKYSKSVSYKTLVGGTATIGTGIKQTRRLIKGTADKPLSAVGTLTSLLCNSAKVVEKLLNRHSEPKAKNPKKTGTVMPDLIGHLSRIKKEAAEIAFGAASQAPCLGSRLLSCPRMTEKVLSFLRLRGASGAQGISATASCREAHKRRFIFNLIRRSLEFFRVPRKNRDDSYCFGFAKVLVLALIFTLSATTESRAEKVCNCGKLNPSDCCWEVKNGTLYITGSGEMKDYSWTYNDARLGITTAPWKEYTYASSGVSKIDIQGVTSIGDCAFRAFQSTQLSIGDTVTSIGKEAFGYSGISGELVLPPSLKNIGESAFAWAQKITSASIPDSVETIQQMAFHGTHLVSIIIPDTTQLATDALGSSSSINIVCKGNEKTCANLNEQLKNYVAKRTFGDQEFYNLDLSEKWLAANSEECTGSYIYENGNCHKRNENQCNDTGDYYYNGATCLYRPRNRQVVCVNPNYKANDGYCDRLRYTPAEAAKVLRDDNNNSVTITFKK